MQMFIKRQLVYVKMSVLRKEKVGGAGWDSAGERRWERWDSTALGSAVRPEDIVGAMGSCRNGLYIS